MSTVGLRYKCINPLDRGEEIKRFVVAAGGDDWSDFPSFFDRSYPPAVERGARSWIAVDDTDEIKLHWACFPRRFGWGETILGGGLMINLVADQNYRNFFPTFTLMKNALGDLEKNEELDFLYGLPNEASQDIILQLGFEKAGDYGRYVLPVSSRNIGVDLFVRAFTAATRLVRGVRGGTVSRRRSQDVDLDELERPVIDGKASIDPFRPPHIYYSRLPGFPGPSYRWYQVKKEVKGEQVLRALVGGIDSSDGYWNLFVAYRGSGQRAGNGLLSLVPALRTDGCVRLQSWAVGGSDKARALKRAGFQLRNKAPLAVMPISQLGEEAVACVSRWNLGMLDVDG